MATAKAMALVLALLLATAIAAAMDITMAIAMAMLCLENAPEIGFSSRSLLTDCICLMCS